VALPVEEGSGRSMVVVPEEAGSNDVVVHPEDANYSVARPAEEASISDVASACAEVVGASSVNSRTEPPAGWQADRPLASPGGRSSPRGSSRAESPPPPPPPSSLPPPLPVSTPTLLSSVGRFDSWPDMSTPLMSQPTSRLLLSIQGESVVDTAATPEPAPAHGEDQLSPEERRERIKEEARRQARLKAQSYLE
jgi:hypothetical protein